MKTSTGLIAAVLAALLLPLGTRAQEEEPFDMDGARRELASDGRWMDVEGYGEAWQPYEAVGRGGWRPYCHGGRWRWTDRGWYWHSTYRWGRLPFHYGRWACAPSVGWVWIPDTAWAPAWVHWRYTERAFGWAPLPPGAAYDIGAGFSYRGRSVGLDFNFGLQESDYVFVPRDELLNGSVTDVAMSSTSFHFRFSRIAARDYAPCSPRVICPGVPYDVACAPRPRPVYCPPPVVYYTPPPVVYYAPPPVYCPPPAYRPPPVYRHHRPAPVVVPAPCPAPEPAPRRPSHDRVIVRQFKQVQSPSPAPRAPRVASPAPRAAPAPAPVVRQRSSGDGRAARLSDIARNRFIR